MATRSSRRAPTADPSHGVTAPEVHGLYFQLKNNSAQANQRCLGIKDGSTKTNAQVTGFTCESYTSRPDQYWIPTELPYTYKNPNNGQNMPCWILSSSITPTLAADTSGASLASGALVINRPCYCHRQ